MTIAHSIRKLALKFGVEMAWHNPEESQKARFQVLLSHHKIRTVLDVGANCGQYGSELRGLGYPGSIISFEPLQSAHDKLTAVAAAQSRWIVAPRTALGSRDGQATINISGNSVSSSIFPMNELHVAALPQASYQGIETVPIRKLDSVITEITLEDNVFLKIDTQGYEKHVLDGARGLIPRLAGIQLELSLAALYEGQTDYLDLIHHVVGQGFELWNVIPGFCDSRTGRLLQMDGIFFRERPCASAR
jgi:FkbM family methyltransferase